MTTCYDPQARLNQIFKRSSQQIYNVTLFFLFFMSLYGLLGRDYRRHGGKQNHYSLKKKNHGDGKLKLCEYSAKN